GPFGHDPLRRVCYARAPAPLAGAIGAEESILRIAPDHEDQAERPDGREEQVALGPKLEDEDHDRIQHEGAERRTGENGAQAGRMFRRRSIPVSCLRRDESARPTAGSYHLATISGSKTLRQS